ncbi:MAG TPA: hypothetical protein VLA72_17800 [Anaerolineales bacterium]|nr:hypothetical protein [Anaerolineales bacterium]
MRTNKKFRFIVVFALIAMLMVSSFPAGATHSWGNYHWARSNNPLALDVVDNMTSDWDDNINGAIVDWNRSSVLDLTLVAGSDDARTRSRCRAESGKLVSCNDTYGNNGWLGLAQIWVKGGHISQGTAKMNDTYFNSPSYDETARSHVVCQEIGHLFGLGHQDESGADLNTCMDYDSNLSNPSPNQHDYQLLEEIYSHVDSGGGGGKPGGGPGGPPNGFENANLRAVENWGARVGGTPDGHSHLYVRDFGNGYMIFTFVVWAE